MLRIYSDIRSYQNFDMNIFEYSFVSKFWYEYIRIFVRIKFFTNVTLCHEVDGGHGDGARQGGWRGDLPGGGQLSYQECRQEGSWEVGWCVFFYEVDQTDLLTGVGTRDDIASKKFCTY